MDKARRLKGIGWRIVFWFALTVSTLWLVISLYFWLSAIRLLSELFRGRPANLNDLLLAVAIAQPLLIAWLIFRAVALRKSRQRWKLIGSGLLPLATVFIFVGAVAVATLQQHLRELHYLDLYSPGNIVTTGYVCERNHAAVDFDRSLLRRVDLELTLITKIGGGRRWIVREVGKSPYTANTFRYGTGSIGGSEGIRWRGHDGKVRNGAISFSDIVGEMGPQTIWVDFPLQSRSEIERDWHSTFTCGPVRQTIKKPDAR